MLFSFFGGGCWKERKDEKRKKSGRVTYLLFSFPFSLGQASLNILVILKLYLYSNLLEGLIKPRQLDVYIPSHPTKISDPLLH